jgi:hypothetical protein
MNPGIPASDSHSHLHSHHSVDSVTERWWRRCRTSLGCAAMKGQSCVSPIIVSAADRLPTFSRHCLLSVNLASISSTRQSGRRVAHPGCIHISLGVQCLVSLSDSLAGIHLPFLQHPRGPKLPASSTEPVHAPGTLDPTTIPETEPAQARLLTVRAVLNKG